VAGSIGSFDYMGSASRFDTDNQRPNNPRQPGGPQQQNRGPGLQQKDNPAAPQRDGLREKLRKLNPFAPKKNEPIR